MSTVTRAECEAILKEVRHCLDCRLAKSWKAKDANGVVQTECFLHRTQVRLASAHLELLDQIEVICKPGQASGIVKAMFDFAEAECGHNPVSARHALTTINGWVKNAKADNKKLLDSRDELVKAADALEQALKNTKSNILWADSPVSSVAIIDAALAQYKALKGDR